ncbi:MAG: S8 family serine peptidase [Nitrososphaeria archaeon]|nr:S8 family serine peptidase [Nitrososphaeria archaeon]NIQ32036.1 S8 family serine peptidase [Nitrososphaeria archaeon]
MKYVYNIIPAIACKLPRQAIEALKRTPNVEFVEPDHEVYIDLTPNDPNFFKLWGLHNTGQTGGTSDADIDAPEAWDIQTGSSDVVIAVIDTGVDYNHVDLSENIWTNPKEIPNNNKDDDGNGYVDDVYGWDFYNDDNNPMDDHGHGTHCSGTIAAVGNNEKGVVGVNWVSKIMALKFLSAWGSGYTSDAVAAVQYVTNMKANGIPVIAMSNSWGGGSRSKALENAIKAADSEGILFVAAAGNSGSNNDVSPHYPSSYEVDNVIAVAATDHNDALAYFSSYGATSVDLAAPGVDILSTKLRDTYSSLSGTSMATPHVSGVAGLLKAQDSTSTHLQVKDLILSSVDSIPSLSGKMVTGGRLNAYNALLSANPGVPANQPPVAEAGPDQSALLLMK